MTKKTKKMPTPSEIKGGYNCANCEDTGYICANCLYPDGDCTCEEADGPELIPCEECSE